MTERGQRARRQTFAEIVDDVRAAPLPPPSRLSTLIAPDGRTFYLKSDGLDPKAALELVGGGAIVAWDSCGSLGYAAPIEWFGPSECAAFIRYGPAELRDEPGRRYRGRGELAEWHTDKGDVLVLASLDVRWGRFIS